MVVYTYVFLDLITNHLCLIIAEYKFGHANLYVCFIVMLKRKYISSIYRIYRVIVDNIT